MIALMTLLSSYLKDKKRTLTLNGAGRGDTRTANECAPAGTDAVPVKNMTAIYLTTDNSEVPVVVGYLNTQQLAAAGEHRLFSMDADGNPVYNIWLKADGTCYMGTSTNIASYTEYGVKHTALSTALAAHTAQINANLAAIATAITALGGTYAPITVTMDISGARVNSLRLQ